MDLTTLNRHRGILKGKITSFEHFLTKVEADIDISQRTVKELRRRVIQFENVYSQFNEIQTEIESLNSDPTFIDIDERDNFESRYFQTIARAEQIISDNVDSNQQQLQSVSTPDLYKTSHVRLPRIELPSFDGDYTRYREFVDVFKALVDSNGNTSQAEKLCYLKMSLKGEAASLLASFDTTDANYDIAFSLLNERYDNTRLTVHNHVRKLLTLENISKESHTGLRKLIDSCERHMRALKGLNLPVDHWDAIIVPILTSKLDHNTAKAWETRINMNDKSEIPKYNDLISFLNIRQATLEAIEVKRAPFESKPSTAVKDYKKRFTAHVAERKITCKICSAEHLLYNCSKFLSLPISDRLTKVKSLKLCNNCLRPSHYANTCKAGGCKICGSKHNTLLHLGGSQNVRNTSEHESQKEASFFSPCAKATENTEVVVLSTARVKLIGKNGDSYEARALLDSGSTACLMSEDFADKLNHESIRLKDPILITGIGNRENKIRRQVRATTKSSLGDFAFEATYLIITNITEHIPFESFSIKNLNIPKNIQLADPSAGETGKIDILLGASIFWDLMKNESIKLPQSRIIMTNTKLGWILGGSLGGQNKKHITCVSLQKIHKDLQKLWSFDEIDYKLIMSGEQSLCEDHFFKTHSCEDDGRFVVRLPFKKPIQVLGESRDIALKRFKSLETKFSADVNLKTRYKEFIDEYIRLGHMKRVNSDDSKFRVYLPHHGVIKESSTTTKLRVVFDASCKTFSGISLNDILMVGPVVQNDLFTILNNFRLFQYVAAGDIEKMYRMVNVHPDDRVCQNILWRDDVNDKIETYELCTLTYGTASASYLATKCLSTIAEKISKTHPVEADVIKNAFYVDDLIFGTNNIADLKQQRESISKILGAYKFNLRKWRSNLPELNQLDGQLSFDQTSKTLGIVWDPQNDTFIYETNSIFCDTNVFTKRAILADTARLFDPLGLLAPVVIIPKMIIQELWCTGMNWDEPISSEFQNKWQTFRRDFESSSKIEIPRFSLCANSTNIQMHGFSDASERAYGACVYLRSTDREGNIQSHLIAAKSKVAPLKKLSIPRLELSAALLLSRLVEKVKSKLQTRIDAEHFWVDSEIVLAWIRAESFKWHTFVANRTSEIKEKTQTESWKHVRSEDNPADLISRGVLPSKLKNETLWWNGPYWLLENTFPETKIAPLTNVSEQKIISFASTMKLSIKLFERYSSLNKLINVLSYIYRFQSKYKGQLTTDERNKTLIKILRIVQGNHFNAEILALKSEKEISGSSDLLRLNPFLDDHGLLRVGGRLTNANLSFDQRHQIILPKHDHVTRIIAMHQHQKSLHCGPQMLVADLRQRFWPIRAKDLAKGIYRNCIKCFKANPRRKFPRMGDLPADRVNPSPPFTICGVDYAGPIEVKESRLRKARHFKAYIALFVCFATKATHVELVSDLTTDSFLAALHRFVSRRGKPTTIWSDNGTNFVGADRALRDIVYSDEINQALNDDNISWKFIPARSPHMGGLWESNVKIVKNHLKRVLGNSILTLEGMQTLLVRIEAMLNSRPLTPLSNDPSDLNPLTPGHFLIGRPLNAVPTKNVESIRNAEYNIVQQMYKDIWNRWRKEYLHLLQTRSKWHRLKTQAERGQLVILVDENTPPLKWPMGRIVEVHQGNDGIVRVATIKTSSGTTRRSIHKICLLPYEDSKACGMERRKALEDEEENH